MPNIKVTRPEFESYWINRHRRKRRLDTLQNLLFGHGENGFLFGNFAEVDELFTTSVGPTNVAANDDSVGLALDDHSWGARTLAQMIASQPEVLTNGDFSGGATGWTVQNADATHIATFSGGTFRYQSDTTSPVLSVFQTPLTAGKLYRVETVCSAYVSGSVKEGATGVVLAAGVGTTVFYIRPPTTSFSFQRNSANVDLTIDSVSVKEIPGNHALQETAANRPLWKANAGKPYLLFDGSNDTLVSPFAPTVATTLAVAFQASAASRIAIGGGDTTAGRRCFIGIDAAGKIGLGWSGDNTVSTGGVGADIRNQNHVAVLTGDASTRELWLDGVQVVSGASSGVALNGTGGGVALGSYNNNGTPTSFLAGNNHAALALNRRVTPTEIARITSDFQRTF